MSNIKHHEGGHHEGGHHEVGGEDVQTAAPHSVTRPDGGREEDQVVPEDPAEVVEAQGTKEVDVDSDTGTSERGGQLNTPMWEFFFTAKSRAKNSLSEYCNM